MTSERNTGETPTLRVRISNSLSEMATREILVILSVATFGFLLSTLSLGLYVNVTPSTSFGESIEQVVPLWYWLGIAIMIVPIGYMMQHIDARKMRIPFLITCLLLIFSVRSVLAIISPLPAIPDVWGRIYVIQTWLKYGLQSPQGLYFFSAGYVRGWPVSFILAYLITYAGIPVYTFFRWAPTIIFMMDVIAIYFLFKEIVNEKTGLISAFLFTLLNTNSVFCLHYTAQTLGALFYLIAMYTLVKAYKTKKMKHLMLALPTILAVVLTHHMTTLWLGISFVGIYFSRYFIRSKPQTRIQKRWFPLAVKPATFITISLSMAVFVFAVWYLYGFIAYPIDATQMLTAIMRLLTTGQPQYTAGYFLYYAIQPPLSRLAVAMYPTLILGTGTMFLIDRMLKKEQIEGSLWFCIGWAGSLVLAFLLGNVYYGNYFDPSRSRELILVAFSPISAQFLLRIFQSKSTLQKTLATIVLVVVAVLSVLSIYRFAQSLVYFDPPLQV